MSNQKFPQLFFLISLPLLLLIGTQNAWAGKKPVSFKSTSSEPIISPRCNQFTFDATGSSDPENKEINYFWYLGDGETSTDAIVNHTYQKSGDYTVTLSLTDNSGLECSNAQTSKVIRANIQPQAVLIVPALVCTNQQIVLDASTSSDDSSKKLNFKWELSDGTNTSGESRLTKIFTKGGDYRISLTVDDGAHTMCSANTLERNIHVNEPPTANAGEDTILVCVNQEENDLTVNFDGSKTVDANNDTLSYNWDFGDGQKGDGVKVTHRYSDLGNYDVKLIVKDNSNLSCNTGVDFVNVRINRAPKAEAGDDIVSCPDTEISFDGSNSYAEKKGTLMAKWFFGDGENADGLKTTHRYNKPGKFQAILSIENQINSQCPVSRDTKNVTINSVPTVSLQTVPSACLGDTVNFDASSAADLDGDSLEYYWSFGDGTVLKAGPKVSHDYKQGGNYRVSVVVDDALGTTCSTATATAQVKINTPPTADAGENLSCCANKEITFDGNGSTDPDGDKLTLTWDFGDGSTAQGATAQHTYLKSGSYNVILTVDDNSGSSCSKSTAGYTAQVNSTPIPVINIR